MINQISYDEIPGFSRVFHDFIRIFPSFNTLLTLSDKKNNLQQILSELENFIIDERLMQIIESSLIRKELSAKQRTNIRELKYWQAYVCTACIKPGFLGGPVNLLMKTLSVIAFSEMMKTLFPEKVFVPVLWIDDDVHDNFESSLSYVFNKDGNIEEFFCQSNTDKNDRTIVAKRYFNEDVDKIINNVIEKLPENTDILKVKNLFEQIYQPDKSWSRAFIELFNKLFKSRGLLFISSNKVRSEGLYNYTTAFELTHRDKTLNIINQNQKYMEFAGKIIRHKATPLNLHIHRHNEVFKCEKKESVRLTDYSPNVMLKPVFQDYLLPTVFRITSPSEFVYSKLLKDVYEFYNVVQPVFVPRYSATFSDGFTQKFLKDYNSGLHEIIDGYPRLHRMFDYQSQIKRTVNWLYPNQQLQERILSLVNILVVSKKRFTGTIINRLQNFEPKNHLLINL
ncbi:bacillithiol biosynthesis BshC [Bacteroidota bacterium]